MTILERQCRDQLPGGKYWNPDSNIQKISSNVPTTNKASESDFAILDLLVRTKPNARIQTMQAFTMWSRNDTSSWIDSKSTEERNNIFEIAQKLVPKMRKRYDERNKELISSKKERLEQKQKEKREMEEKAAAKKLSAVNNLVEAGHRVWLCEEEADECSSSIDDDKERCRIIHMQILFYKDVLNVKCPHALFYKTKSVEGKRVF